MVSSMRSGIYTIVENLMMTPGLPATDESRKVARDNGLAEPLSHADMARQLLDMMEEKCPATYRLTTVCSVFISRAPILIYTCFRAKCQTLKSRSAQPQRG